MLYEDKPKWVEQIDLIETHEKVLGGLGGPTNRPTIELANRTRWLYENMRIPILENLTLEVTAAGNDETGGLDSPFRQPQAAIDWAIANLDFRNPTILTISLQTGSYEHLEIRAIPQGVIFLKINGTNSDNTLIKYLSSHAPCEIEISDVGFNGYAANRNNAMIIAYTGATIILTNNVSFFPQPGCCPVISHNGGHIFVQNANFILRPGSYFAIFTVSSVGTVRVGSSSIMVDTGVSVSNAFVYSTLAGVFISENMPMSNTITGKRYTADSGGRILSNSTADTWACSQPGTNDGTALVI